MAWKAPNLAAFFQRRNASPALNFSKRRRSPASRRAHFFQRRNTISAKKPMAMRTCLYGDGKASNTINRRRLERRGINKWLVRQLLSQGSSRKYRRNQRIRPCEKGSHIPTGFPKTETCCLIAADNAGTETSCTAKSTANVVHLTCDSSCHVIFAQGGCMPSLGKDNCIIRSRFHF